MTFIVKRASDLTARPCEEARRGFAAKIKSLKNAWVVEIDSLEDLVDFKNKYGAIVLDDYNERYSEILIYDDWIERL